MTSHGGPSRVSVPRSRGLGPQLLRLSALLLSAQAGRAPCTRSERTRVTRARVTRTGDTTHQARPRPQLGIL